MTRSATGRPRSKRHPPFAPRTSPFSGKIRWSAAQTLCGGTLSSSHRSRSPSWVQESGSRSSDDVCGSSVPKILLTAARSGRAVLIAHRPYCE